MPVKNYESVFILTPVLAENQVSDVAEKFKQVLKENSADLVHDESMGLRQLAYPIQKKSTGHYYLVEFAAESQTVVDALELAFRRDDRVLRFLTVSLDKHALTFSQRRRNGEFNKKPMPETADAQTA